MSRLPAFLFMWNNYLMSRSSKGVSGRALLTVALSIFAIGTAKAQPGVIGEVLKRMENHYKTLSTLKANVKTDDYTAQLDEHFVREGSLIYIPVKGRDAAFRIDWTKPKTETLHHAL